MEQAISQPAIATAESAISQPAIATAEPAISPPAIVTAEPAISQPAIATAEPAISQPANVAVEPPQAEQHIDPQGESDAEAEQNEARVEGYEPTPEPLPTEDDLLYDEENKKMVENIETGVRAKLWPAVLYEEASMKRTRRRSATC